MKRQLIFSRKYPANHPKKGQPTNFVEKIWAGRDEFEMNKFFTDNKRADEEFNAALFYPEQDFEPKLHTIRNGNRRKVGDVIIPCVWELPGGLYKKGNRKIQFAPEMEVVKIWDFTCIVDHDGDMNMWIQKEDSTIFTISHFRMKVGYVYSPPESVKKFRDLCKNDGLLEDDLINWFQGMLTKKNNKFSGQILCWNKDLEY